MASHNFILRKTQQAVISVKWESHETIGDVTERLEKLSEGELNFGEPEYELVAISKTAGKINKIIWQLS